MNIWGKEVELGGRGWFDPLNSKKIIKNDRFFRFVRNFCTYFVHILASNKCKIINEKRRIINVKNTIINYLHLVLLFLLYPEVEVSRNKDQQYSANMLAFHFPENLRSNLAMS